MILSTLPKVRNMETKTFSGNAGNNGNASLNTQSLRSAAASATAEAHEAIDKASDIAIPAIDRLAASAHTAVDKFSDVAAEVTEKIVVTGKQLKETQERLLASGRHQVQANPAVSVVIAMAAGYLLCKLMQARH